jgi:hypothetical protein
MKAYKYLIAALCFYFVAIVSSSIALSFAQETRYGIKLMGEGVDSGLSGGAAGFCIIAASLIISGSFFLYKHFED